MAFTRLLLRMPQLVLLSLLTLTACKPATSPGTNAQGARISGPAAKQPSTPIQLTPAKIPMSSDGEKTPPAAVPYSIPAPESVPESVSESVPESVPEPVIAPMLHCTSDRVSAHAGEAIQIDCGLTGGNRSFDAFSFSWSVRHAGIDENLGSTTSTRLTYMPIATGDLHFEILAEDGETQATAALDVRIEPPPLSVSCPATLNITLGQTATLNCSISNASADEAAVETRWALLSTPVSVVLPTQTGSSLTFAPPIEGAYELQFIADDGTAHITRSINLTVNPLSSGLRILPLGDSITQSNGGHKSYRYALWQRLVDGGVDFDFIGSEHNNAGGPADWPEYAGQRFDQDHEGHWGWRADEILGNLDMWLSGYPAAPDAVLLHLGTNDLFQGQTTESTLADLGQIIARLRKANTSVSVFVAVLIPTTRDENSAIDAFNQTLTSFVANQFTAQSPVILVNQNDGYSAASDSFDGIHPNASGEEKMAQKWYEALQSSGLI